MKNDAPIKFYACIVLLLSLNLIFAQSASSSVEYPSLPEDYKRFRLNISFNNIYTRQLIETFNDNATEGFDYGLESKSIQILPDDAYFVVNDEPYLSEALPYDESISIPLTIALNNDSSIVIEILDIQNFGDQLIYLHDSVDNTYTNLRENSYRITLDANNYTDRFELTFVEREENIHEDSDDNTTNENDEEITTAEKEPIDIFHNKNKSELTIINNYGSKIKEIIVYDIEDFGRVLYHKEKLKTKDRYAISTAEFNRGVYFVKIKNPSDQEHPFSYKKFFVK